MENSKVTNIINVVGNAALIYGAGMATGGAAISTLLSRFAAAIVILRLLLNQERELHFFWNAGDCGKCDCH